MKTTIALAALALAVAAPAVAGEQDITRLAEHSGLSERQVQMIVGPRSAYAGYRTSYDRCYRQFVASIGQDNYQRLMAGEPLLLPRRDAVDTAVAVVSVAPAR